MTEQTNKKYTLLTILVAGLLVAFVAQSLALYGMQKRLTQMTATQPASPPVASAPATPASASLTPVTGPATDEMFMREYIRHWKGLMQANPALTVRRAP